MIVSLHIILPDGFVLATRELDHSPSLSPIFEYEQLEHSS